MGTKSLSAPHLGAHSLRTNGPAQSGVHDDRKPGFHFWSHTDKPSASSSPHGLQLLAGPLPPAERPLLSSASGQSHLPSTPALAPPCPSHPCHAPPTWPRPSHPQLWPPSFPPPAPAIQCSPIPVSLLRLFPPSQGRPPGPRTHARLCFIGRNVISGSQAPSRGLIHK